LKYAIRRCIIPGGRVASISFSLADQGDLMSAVQPRDTKQTPNRRELNFTKIDEALVDVEVIAAAERAGRARCLGNWSTGQILDHLASWADYAFDGTPLHPPFVIRLLLRPMKRRFLHKKMPAGGKIPKVPGGTLAIAPASLDDGLAHFRMAFVRLRDQAPTAPHVIFGRLAHDEWINMHLRHAELHLSFIRMD
jgi:hypothetical protein